MKGLFDIANHFIEGKPVYPKLRRIFNLLLNICMASYFYERIQGPYEWYDYNDYKRILDFLIKGAFFIPFSILVLVSVATEIAASGIFYLLTHARIRKITKAITEYQASREDLLDGYQFLEMAMRYTSTTPMNPEKLKKAYPEFRDLVLNEISDFKEILNAEVTNLGKNFAIGLRFLMASVIFYQIVPDFPESVFIGLVIVILLILGILVLGYWLFEAIPPLLEKIVESIERHGFPDDPIIRSDPHLIP